jgi:hypothetical protein
MGVVILAVAVVAVLLFEAYFAARGSEASPPAPDETSRLPEPAELY